ncbi:hypothetical protein [Pseudofrankia sp. BMG5.37]|uniref:hypothetical protein n=1 Tax=Pseudofrankia sp. BMG5.37 TaxID=3050035 RepID=UPI002895C1B5|nr:hypothetical protein [Pseudofrankia sp. BMG5.37]MDT3438525.1 hypothetical protein [Pseudofrankia sp. BMG5.37]
MSGTDPWPDADRYDSARPVGHGGGTYDTAASADQNPMGGPSPRGGRASRDARRDRWVASQGHQAPPGGWTPGDDPLFGPMPSGPTTGGLPRTPGRFGGDAVAGGDRARPDGPREAGPGFARAWHNRGGLRRGDEDQDDQASLDEGFADDGPGGDGFGDDGFDEDGFGDEPFANEEFDGETASRVTGFDEGHDEDENPYVRTGGGSLGGRSRTGGRFGARGARFAAQRSSDGPSDEDSYGDADEPRAEGAGGKPRRKWQLLFIAAAVLAVAGVTYRTMTGSQGDDTPAAPIPTAKAVPADFLNSAATDADPVTENEFFRDATVTAGSHTYTRIARKLDAGCPDLTGQLGSALDHPAAPMPAAAPTPGPTSVAAAAAPASSAGPASAAPPSAAPTLTGPACRQEVRALYLGEPDKNGRRLLAGVSVLVVDNADTAKQTAQMLGTRQGGVSPLPLPDGALPGAKITGPNGDNELRASYGDGHYAIMVQLAYSDGSQGAANDKQPSDAATALHALAKQPLDERMLLGRGYRG